MKILIVILITSLQTFSQVKPSEKDTFDFISYYIENKVIDDTDSNIPLKKFKSNKKNKIIEYESSWLQAPGSKNEFKVTDKYIIDFKKIKSVSIKSFEDKKIKNWSSKGYWSVSINFKEKAIKVYTPKTGVYPPNVIYEDVRWNDRGYEIYFRNETAFFFDLKDEKEAKKFYKSINHFIKLRTGVNTSLFD